MYIPEHGDAGVLLLIGPTSRTNPPPLETSCITADNEAQMAFSSGNVAGCSAHFLAPPRNSRTSWPDPALKELIHQLLRRWVGEERKTDLVVGWRRLMSRALMHRIRGIWRWRNKKNIKIIVWGIWRLIWLRIEKVGANLWNLKMKKTWCRKKIKGLHGWLD